MCGIFGYNGYKKDADSLVLTGLRTLEYRGYDSWGIASVNLSGNIDLIKKVGKIGTTSLSNEADSSIAIGHTRWATHGGVTVNNAHPHLDCHKNLALIHNGIIENYTQIKAVLVKKNHIFKSETDTEVAVHLIEEFCKKMDFQTAVFSAFKEFKGLNAIIVMDRKSKIITAAKNGSPLIIGKGKNENFIASDAHALLPYTRDLYFMEDDQAVMINDKLISVYDLKSGKNRKINYTYIDWIIENEVKGKHQHFMLKEIYDQVSMLEFIAKSKNDGIKKFAGLISEAFGTYLVGCGTASYACLAGTYIMSKIANKHVNFSIASEFGYLLDFLTPKSLVIGLSQSGETIDLIDALKKARSKKAKIASFVNVLGSSLYRMSDEKMLLNAGIERAVVSTKAFTAKLAHLILIAFEIKGDRKTGNKIINSAVIAVRKLFMGSNLTYIKNIADTLRAHEHIYLIGRGLSYPIAMETALKIKEASYIHAEGFAGGELKHGVIALVEKNTPCIAFLPDDETYDDTISSVMEMKARGGFMIGIGNKKHEVFDMFLSIPDCNIATSIPNVIVGQLLGYYLAVNKGLDPDKPRNLAKSVTVK